MKKLCNILAGILCLSLIYLGSINQEPETPESLKLEDAPVHICSLQPSQEEQADNYIKSPVYSDSEKLVDLDLSPELQRFIFHYSEENRINPYLVFALIEQESGCDASSVGDDGQSYGLMQINVQYHRERMSRLNCEDIMNPYDNVRVGINILLECFEENEDVYWALMAYNGWFEYADKHIDSPTAYAVHIVNRAWELEHDSKN